MGLRRGFGPPSLPASPPNYKDKKMNEGMNTLERAVPSQEPSLEVVNNNSLSTRETITDIERAIQSIEDFLQGARPEKPQEGVVEGCPSGILAQLCVLGASNHDRLMDVQRRVVRMANNLGVPQ